MHCLHDCRLRRSNNHTAGRYPASHPAVLSSDRRDQSAATQEQVRGLSLSQSVLAAASSAARPSETHHCASDSSVTYGHVKKKKKKLQGRSAGGWDCRTAARPRQRAVHGARREPRARNRRGSDARVSGHGPWTAAAPIQGPGQAFPPCLSDKAGTVKLTLRGKEQLQ